MRGDVYELSWVATGASRVEIDGYGIHPPEGSTLVAFDGTVSRRLAARGPGGVSNRFSPPVWTLEPPDPRLPRRPNAGRALGRARPGSAVTTVPQVPRASELLADAAPPSPAGAGRGPGPADGGDPPRLAWQAANLRPSRWFWASRRRADGGGRGWGPPMWTLLPRRRPGRATPTDARRDTGKNRANRTGRQAS
ncbi:hypothetical protein FRAAL0218 [Frankia alni ACN14a]|uniref:Uncharacterized protein n=1 Tax=Frankia alni (strain DSM 45986 / CECT 9034 / ACN14a) TaxID=326424 RepID=Q0RU48_FRAAA|nr:hypothetical protein FRAAL0218 [Frankia alni ACN14a]